MGFIVERKVNSYKKQTYVFGGDFKPRGHYGIRLIDFRKADIDVKRRRLDECVKKHFKN